MNITKEYLYLEPSDSVVEHFLQSYIPRGQSYLLHLY